MSLFAHRSYKPDEQIDPIDAEMLKRGRARLKLQDDGSFLLVDNADLNGTTLAAEVMRMKIAKQLENDGKGGDRAHTTSKAVAWSECLRRRYAKKYGKKPKWKDTDAKAARKYKRSENRVRTIRQEKQREKRLK